jgi:hypothetical protein
MQNDTERKYLEKYKKTLHFLESQERSLCEVNDRIKELSFEDEEKNAADIMHLRETASYIETFIDNSRKNLQKLEATPTLKNVIERESIAKTLRQREKEAEELWQYYSNQNKNTSQDTEHYTYTAAKYIYIIIFLRSLSLILPLIMLDTPIWLICIVTFILFSPLLFGSLLYTGILYCLYDIVRPILYICGLVVTIQGKQDFFAIAFYVLMGLQIVNIIKRFLGTVCGIMLAYTNKE